MILIEYHECAHCSVSLISEKLHLLCRSDRAERDTLGIVKGKTLSHEFSVIPLKKENNQPPL